MGFDLFLFSTCRTAGDLLEQRRSSRRPFKQHSTIILREGWERKILVLDWDDRPKVRILNAG